MAAKGPTRVNQDVPVAVLREVQAVLMDDKVNEFLAPLERLGAKMSWTVMGSKTRLGYFLFRLVFVQFREGNLKLRDAREAVESIALRGGLVTDMDRAFKEELFFSATKHIFVNLTDQVAFARCLAEKGLLGWESLKNWSGETLADALNGVFSSKLGRRSADEGEVTAEVIEVLVELGATPAAEPPRIQQERSNVGFYLANIEKPKLSNAFYSAWHAHDREASQPASKGTGPRRARPVSKKALQTVIKTLREVSWDPDTGGVSWDPDTGEQAETREQRENFERILDCMTPRYLPLLVEPGPSGTHWKGSLVGGEMFSSEKYPWPETKGYPDAPLVQLELDAITAATGVNVGAGFLQVWRRIGFSTKEERSASLKVRVIPRQLVMRKQKPGPTPAKYAELSAHPDYSWRSSRPWGPKIVKGWKQFGYAVPNPDLLLFEVLESALFSEETKAILDASRHDCALELFGIPQPARAFLKLPSDWRPLATIYGPMHGMACREFGDPVHDISQVYFRCVEGKEFEYRCYSWRTFD